LAAVQTAWPAAVLIDDHAATDRVAKHIFAPARQHSPERIPLFIKGTNFQINVWKALLGIPPGHLSSYEHVARASGNPNAARAVGQAIGANPVAYLIPCHRVIRGAGIIGGYRWNPVRKRAMIAWEAARTRGDDPMLDDVSQG
jgi:AraC family transcriptional regulator of adaptative response/methylated-DNA-[protein]-cysteine methyltransferase